MIFFTFSFCGALKVKKLSIELLRAQITTYKRVVNYVTKNFLSEVLLTDYLICEVTKNKEINTFSNRSSHDNNNGNGNNNNGNGNNNNNYTK